LETKKENAPKKGIDHKNKWKFSASSSLSKKKTIKKKGFETQVMCVHRVAEAFALSESPSNSFSCLLAAPTKD
jgi:hypothetical protein